MTLHIEALPWQPEHLRLTLAGRLDSETAPAFEARWLTLLQDSPWQAAVLDCAALSYIASAGLRVVLMGAKRAQARGTRLIISGLQPSVREVFAISGFLKILSVADSFEDAQALLRP